MKKNLIKKMALAGMMVLTCFAFVGCGKKTIDISEYSTVEFKGADGSGFAKVNVDWDAIKEDYGDDLEYTKEAQEEYGQQIAFWYGTGTEGKIDILRSATDDEFDKDVQNTLSNGDEFTYTFELDEELEGFFNYEITASEVTVEVEGLE